MEERLEHDAAVAARRADDPELELAGGDPLDDRLRVEDPQHDVQLRVQRLELAEQVREHDPAGAGRGADLERPLELVGRLLGDLGDDLLLEREQPLRAAIEPHARLGRLDPPPRAVEQLRPEPLLERPDLQAHRRLGDPEPLGGLREAAPLDDRAERCQLARVHKQSLYRRTLQLEPVSERVVDEEPVDARDLRVVLVGSTPPPRKPRADRVEIGDDEPGMRLARRGERLLDADVQLLRPARNQQPPRARIGSGFGSSSIPSSSP